MPSRVKVGHLRVADHLEQGVEADPRPHRAGLEVLGLERLVAGGREVGAERLVDRELGGRRRVRPDEHHLLGEVAQVGDVLVRERAEARADEQLGAQLLAGLHDLDGLLLAEGQGHPVRAGVLRAEDELAEVGGAARHRGVVRERGLALVGVGEEALQRGRGGQVDADEADLLGARLDERLRHAGT